MCVKIMIGVFMTEYSFYISNKEIRQTAKDCLRGSWKASAGANLLMCIICLIPVLLAVFLSIFVVWWISIPLGLFCLYVFAIMRYGYACFCLKLARQEVPTKRDLFVGFSKRIKDILSLTTKKIFLSLFWLVVFVFPFFVKSIGYSMSTLLLIDRHDITSANALTESKHLMEQNYMRYFKLLLSNFWWYFLVLVTAGFAYIWVNGILQTKKALFYENLKTDF